jgi:Icc-related predicted phosphoesterase
VIRIAAVGDVHFGPDAAGSLRPCFESLVDQADVLLLAGDLTRIGQVEEAAALADELRGVDLPVVAVLGNHDYHSGQEERIAGIMTDAGAEVLEGEATVVEVGGTTVGIAGVKGFGGGFLGACGSEFGEPLMKAFVRHTEERAELLFDRLAMLETDVRVALTHYAPAEGTLRGERLEIFPFLGAYQLGEAVDRAGADLAVHGHAHKGAERALTPGGCHVRNVAQPVLRRACAIYCLEPHRRDGTTGTRRAGLRIAT